MAEEEFENIADAIKALGLFADPNDVDAVKGELKIRLSEVHPDKRSDPDERTKRLTQALSLTNSNKISLSIIDHQQSAIQLLTPSQGSVEQALQSSIQERREQEAKAVSKPLFLPRISLGAVAIALVWVGAFPKTLKDNPFVFRLLTWRYSTTLWIASILLLVCVWLSLWFYEQWKLRFLDHLLSLEHQKETLHIIGLGNEGPFSASQYQNQLYPLRRKVLPPSLQRLAKVLLRKRLYSYSNPFYDLQLAERAAIIGLSRALDRKWIRPSSPPEGARRVDDWYSFTKE